MSILRTGSEYRDGKRRSTFLFSQPGMLMILGLLQRWAARRTNNPKVVERLHAEITRAARHPVLYTDYKVDDSFEGRFEMLTLHAALVLRHLKSCPEPGKDIAQDLVDTIFRHFEIALREMGVGDVSVPKRMKVFVEAFSGRCAAYEKALPLGEEAFARSLVKNVYGTKSSQESFLAAMLVTAQPLARYVFEIEHHLGPVPIESLSSGNLSLPSPAPLPK